MTLYITPTRRLTNLRDVMERMVGEAYGEATPQEREMVLAVDVKTEDEAYTVSALVPGLEAEDLNIEILDKTVTIRGEFKPESEGDAKYLTCELPQGRFNRVISLPVAVDPSKAEAGLKNGVLTLHIPKAEAHRPRAIKISKN